MTPSSILPTSERLLRGLRTALQEIVQGEPLGEAAMLRLNAADTVLNELQLREQGSRQAKYYRSCRQLVDDGVALVGSDVTNAAALPVEIDPRWRFDEASKAIHDALGCLSALVHIVSREQADDARAYVERVLLLELELHRQRHESAMPSQLLQISSHSRLIRQRIEDYLAHRFGQGAPRLQELQELVGGFQKRTLLLSLVDTSGRPDDVVIRLEKDHDKYVNLDAGTVAAEYEIVRFIHAKGIPSAEPRFLETDPAWLGGSFMVTSRMPGRSIKVAGSDPSAGQTRLNETCLRSVVEVLAAIHALPVDELADSAIGLGLAHADLAANSAAAVASWSNQRWSRYMMHTPTTRYAMDWLHANIPTAHEDFALVHVDFGTHNLLIDNDIVTAVLDWESARIGDPIEDLAYFLQSIGTTEDREAIIGLYEEATGKGISKYRIRYWDVYNALKVILASGFSSALYQNDPRADIEWCSLALNIFPHGANGLLAKIAAAEAARGT